MTRDGDLYDAEMDEVDEIRREFEREDRENEERVRREQAKRMNDDRLAKQASYEQSLREHGMRLSDGVYKLVKAEESR